MDVVLTAVVLVAVGVASGTIAGLLGVGGGILLVPVLVLAFDRGQHSAEATSLAVVLPTAIVSSVLLHRKGIGNLPVALKVGAVGTLGAIGGSLLALALPARTLQVVFAVFLAAVGVQVIVRGHRMPRTADP